MCSYGAESRILCGVLCNELLSSYSTNGTVHNFAGRIKCTVVQFVPGGPTVHGGARVPAALTDYT